MKLLEKRYKLLAGALLTGAFVFLLTLPACLDTDPEPTCAGCTDDAPWSVAGSSECYYTYDDCERSERGNCTICN